MTGRPLILVDPLPRTLPMICAPDVRARLEALGRLEVSDAAPMDPARVDALLPEAVALIGQTDLPAERIARAERLRVVINVEGNFLPNVDYAACRARGVHVLCASPAFADAGGGERARDGDRPRARDRRRRPGDARRARSATGLESNAGAFLLTGAPVGIVGFGDLGRALRRLLAPFRCPVRVFDPWLPAEAIRREGAEPGGARRPARRLARRVRARGGDERQRRLPRRARAAAAAGGRGAGADEPGGRRRLRRAGARRGRGPDPRGGGRVPGGAAPRRSSAPRARRRAALPAPRGRDAGGVPGDRPARGRRPRARPARPAARALPPRGGRDVDRMRSRPVARS